MKKFDHLLDEETDGKSMVVQAGWVYMAVGNKSSIQVDWHALILIGRR